VETAQCASWRERQSTNEGEEGNHSQTQNVDQWETPVNQVEKRPIIGCRCTRGKREVSLTDDLQPVVAWRGLLVIRTELALWQRCQAWAVHDYCTTSPAAIGRDERRLVEGVS